MPVCVQSIRWYMRSKYFVQKVNYAVWNGKSRPVRKWTHLLILLTTKFKFVCFYLQLLVSQNQTESKLLGRKLHDLLPHRPSKFTNDIIQFLEGVLLSFFSVMALVCRRRKCLFGEAVDHLTPKSSRILPPV
jgi:hypothetical protein